MRAAEIEMYYQLNGHAFPTQWTCITNSMDMHYQLNGHEFEQTPGDGEGQGAWHAAVHGITKNWT